MSPSPLLTPCKSKRIFAQSASLLAAGLPDSGQFMCQFHTARLTFYHIREFMQPCIQKYTAVQRHLRLLFIQQSNQIHRCKQCLASVAKYPRQHSCLPFCIVQFPIKNNQKKAAAPARLRPKAAAQFWLSRLSLNSISPLRHSARYLLRTASAGMHTTGTGK